MWRRAQWITAVVGKTAILSATVLGVYAAFTLASDWLVLKSFWRQHTRASEYDPERDVFV